MSQSPSDEWLTAAECAARTGLTVKALRVYEDQGLITPGRSAGGWRRYGSSELLALNTIGLLKVLGLSLAQIRDATRARHPPPLKQVLELQLRTWQSRRADAERGQAIAEAALRRLDTHRSLSIESLCSLIRSFDMSPSTADSTSGPTDESLALDTTILDRYVGHYQRGQSPSGLFTITRQGDKLFMQLTGQPSLELYPISETEFASRAVEAQVGFHGTEGGAAKSLLLQQRGIDFTAGRIDEAIAAQLQAALAERIKSRTPMPGSEQALRKTIDAVRAGAPNYEDMSPEFAQVIRNQAPRLQALSLHLGAVVGLEFQGVSSQGSDMYNVQREQGAMHMRIALGSDGKIYGLMSVLS